MKNIIEMNFTVNFFNEPNSMFLLVRWKNKADNPRRLPTKENSKVNKTHLALQATDHNSNHRRLL